MAVSALMKREVARIILTRPAVEAGERLGFLPGDLIEKIHPYLRPLYDALYDMLEPDKVATLSEKGAIEIAPLAYMRGRTLNDAFIILDEAQNTTSEQMKMFLTRLGFNAKMVITGDITQVDLPPNRPSGLIEVQTVLAGHRRHPVRLLRRPRRGAARPRLGHRPRLRPRLAGRRHAPAPSVGGRPRRPAAGVSVSIQNRQRHVSVLSARLGRLATRALAAVGRAQRDVHVAVVDDREIRRLNRRYLGARGATDVLAFDLGLGVGPQASSRSRPAGSERPAPSPRSSGSARFAPSSCSSGAARPAPSRLPRERPSGRRTGPPSLLGEIIISGETAARQAARLEVPATLELELLLVHGLLHLAGYDDHAPAEARLMHERARDILASSRRRPVPDRLFTGLLDPGAATGGSPRRSFSERPATRLVRVGGDPLGGSTSSRPHASRSARLLTLARSPSGGERTPRTPPSEREKVAARGGARSRMVRVRAGVGLRATRAKRGHRA